jgi:hypothetical protein
MVFSFCVLDAEIGSAAFAGYSAGAGMGFYFGMVLRQVGDSNLML